MAKTWLTRFSFVAPWSGSNSINPRQSRQLGDRRRRVLSVQTLERREMMTAEIAGPLVMGPTESSEPALARIITPQPTSSTTSTLYPSVGMVGDTRGSFCTGTLIASQYVLTAAHCAVGVADTAGRFVVNNQLYSTNQVIVHPQYNAQRLNTDLANDIAIYRLTSPVTGVTPSPINRTAPALGQTLTLVGFGAGGTAAAGHDNRFGTLRVGTTPIDRITPTIIGWRFDNASESNTAPGDSGGPQFVSLGGINHVASVTSGGTVANASIGDNSFNTRVDAYLPWIDSILAGGAGNTSTSSTAPAVPATVVSIRASDPNAAETGPTRKANPGSYTITRTGSTAKALTVRLTTSGTATSKRDYAALPRTVTIPAGRRSVVIPVVVIDDKLVEPVEMVQATIGAGSGYAVSESQSMASVNIVSDEIPKPNDAFDKRQAIRGSSGRATGSNLYAASEANEPLAATSAGRKTIWFTWTATFTGTAVMSTAGSKIDTAMAVYSGSAVDQLQLVAANNDENAAKRIRTSRVEFQAVAGTSYQVQVDGVRGATGDITLTLSRGATVRSMDPSELTSENRVVVAPPATPSSVTPAAISMSSVNETRDRFFASLY